MRDCITILAMFPLTKQKCGLLWQVVSPFDIFRLIIRLFSLKYPLFMHKREESEEIKKIEKICIIKICRGRAHLEKLLSGDP